MAMWRLLAVGCVVLAGAAGPAPSAPAPAPAAPVLQPSRDSIVAYHLAPARGEAIDVLVSFRAGGSALRMDLPDHTYMVAVPEAETLMLVVPEERTVADLPWAVGPQALFLPDPHFGWTRKGEATVAGVKCTQWEASREPTHNLICLTGDGVLMRNQFQDGQGRKSLIEGLGMKQTPLVEAMFSAPIGFQRVHPLTERGLGQ